MGKSMEVPQKSKNKLPYDLVIPLLGVYTDKTLIQKDICTYMLTAAVFTRAETWKQPKPSSTDEWIKMWCVHTHTHTHTHTQEYYPVIKKNKIMPFAATWMQLENTILGEVSQKEKNKYHVVSLLCGI